MRSKFKKFNDLALDLKVETALSLSNRDLVNLALTSTYHLALFKPVIDVRKFLHHVTRGEHDVVKAMLMQNINLIFKKGKVTDWSSREFESISGFEYALWALDKHMWATMMDCIPSTEEGKAVFAQLIAQYNRVNTDGVTYRLNGTSITEKHFDFKNTIIKELQTQVDLRRGPNGPGNWRAAVEQWIEGVGGAQKRLPMHVIDEYFSNEPFYPVPEFTTQPKASKKLICVYLNEDENWFNVVSKLSVELAMYKGEMAKPWGGTLIQVSVIVRASRDLAAMTKLCEVRTNDFIHLKSELEGRITPTSHHQVSQISPK